MRPGIKTLPLKFTNSSKLSGIIKGPSCNGLSKRFLTSQLQVQQKSCVNWWPLLVGGGDSGGGSASFVQLLEACSSDCACFTVCTTRPQWCTAEQRGHKRYVDCLLSILGAWHAFLQLHGQPNVVLVQGKASPQIRRLFPNLRCSLSRSAWKSGYPCFVKRSDWNVKLH